MRVNELILRNLKKNIKNYYLYVFALVFSTALYFAFVTLQYDPSLDQAKGSIKGAASIRAASILLVVIVSVFLLYANNIFIKRRSKEIGLFQLIGMTKGKIFRLLTAENAILYFSSLFIGVFLGFASSRLILMILFKITRVETETTLRFSTEALTQTIIVFCVIFGFIMLMNLRFINKQSILSLFRVTSSTEGRVKKLSFLEMLVGLVGIALIAVGYYVSSKLFSGDFTEMNELFLAMVFILGAVILGTYLFYKGSVSFVFHLIRKSKNGYLNINEVLSLSSIMFRMKSNALLLTIITTVSALAIGLLSLSYISYYSAEKKAANHVAGDFSIPVKEDAEKFARALEDKQIHYEMSEIEVIQINANLSTIIGIEDNGINADPSNFIMPVISDKQVHGFDVSPEETIFAGFDDLLHKFMQLKDSGDVELKGKTEIIPQKYLGIEKDYLISWYFTYGGIPVGIVDDSIFQRLKKDQDPAIQKESSLHISFVVEDEYIDDANAIFENLGFADSDLYDSRINMSQHDKTNMGLIMFIVGFLGLTFLITSGCILYFKQMGEGEEEKPSYNILRKLGFTQGDLVKGIRSKQIFNFGIPLCIGLLHSYFAVQSGWFLFGTEVWTPMIVVMVLYTILYSIFGLLSVLYYKKVIKDAL